MLHGVVLQEGRAAQTRAEVFSPLSVIWPSAGIGLLGAHHGPELARAIPTRAANGEIRIAAHASAEILAAYETRKFFSVEFFSSARSELSQGSARFNAPCSTPPPLSRLLSTCRRSPKCARVVVGSGCDEAVPAEARRNPRVLRRCGYCSDNGKRKRGE